MADDIDPTDLAALLQQPSTADVIRRMPKASDAASRVVPDWLIQQQREAQSADEPLHGESFPSALFEPLGTLAAPYVNAAKSINAAVHDPSLPNLTGAGVKTALAAGRVGLATKLAGLGYAGAVASDTGLLGPEEAEAGGSKAASPQLPGLPPELNTEYAKLLKKVTAGDFESSADRVATKDRLKQIQDLSNTSVLQGGKGKADEYNRAVESAEAARNAEFARNRRFSDTTTGKVYDATGGLSPFFAGALTGAVSRMVPGAPGFIKNYLVPGGLGAIAGGAMANLPLAYDALSTEAENPIKRGEQAYAHLLPDTHPDKASATEYANSLDSENPVRTHAAAEFYDPKKLAERLGMGGSEGGLGGLLGSDLIRILGRFGTGGRGPGPSGPGQAGSGNGGLPGGTPGLPGTPDTPIPLEGQTIQTLEAPPVRLTDRMAASREAAGPPPAAPVTTADLASILQDLKLAANKNVPRPPPAHVYQPREKGKFSGPPEYPEGDERK